MSHQFAAVLLCAVASAATASSQPVESAGIDPGTKLDLQHGREVYRSSCAQCHDTGLEGAPALRDQKAWGQRSFQWFSVLQAHATKGFLNMPAKGQKPTLTDQDMADAVFYMMEERRQPQ
ncbi:MAG: c-type cytochrome [Methylotetracoccus sp.]|nr:c-type cytochrome [Methylotetracoccus sp.]